MSDSTRDAILVDIINDAARQVATGPGRKQAWLSEVWEQVLRNGKDGDLFFEDFMEEIVRLYRAQEISLSPAPKILSPEMQLENDHSLLEIDGRELCMLNIPTGHQVSAPPPKRGGGAITDEDFAARVKAIAKQIGPSFGDRKVFIGEIWQAAQGASALRALGEQEFKRRLVVAHQAGLLVLSRADLVAAMNHDQVMAAETVTDGATFHFVNIDPPRRNPGQRGRRKSLPLVRNPPSWVADMIAGSYETLEETIKPEWLPKLTDFKRIGVDGLSASAHEYGCGAYGCVFPTLDPNVVMKVTSDDTEAQFAAEMSPTLVAPICVTYHTVLKLDAKRDRFGVYLLWRDSASWVGDLDAYLDEETGDPEAGNEFMRLVNLQHDAARSAMIALHRKAAENVYKPLLNRWMRTLKEMATQQVMPQLSELAAGMMEVFLEQKIAILDIHSGNLGLVDDKFVITDPGHVFVVDA